MKFLSKFTKKLMLDYSPIEHLSDHADKVHQTVYELSNALTDYMEGKKVKRDKISDLEHEADKVKQDIRNHLPRSDLLMPVARTDLLSFIWQQDQIADSCQAAVTMLSLLSIDLKGEFNQKLRQLSQVMVNAADVYLEIIKVTSDALIGSLNRKRIDEIWKMIKKMDELEHVADQIERELIRQIYNDQKLGGFEKYHLIQVVRKSGDTIDYMENAGQSIRIMTSL